MFEGDGEVGLGFLSVATSEVGVCGGDGDTAVIGGGAAGVARSHRSQLALAPHRLQN